MYNVTTARRRYMFLNWYGVYVQSLKSIPCVIGRSCALQYSVNLLLSSRAYLPALSRSVIYVKLCIPVYASAVDFFACNARLENDFRKDLLLLIYSIGRFLKRHSSYEILYTTTAAIIIKHNNIIIRRMKTIVLLLRRMTVSHQKCTE